MLGDAVEQLGSRLVLEISQVRTVKRCVSRQVIRKVEAESDLSLKPRLYGVPIGGDDLRGRVRRKRSNMLIANLGHKVRGLI
jgi:hypothetical protein